MSSRSDKQDVFHQPYSYSMLRNTSGKSGWHICRVISATLVCHVPLLWK